jgi:hypothetical protein
MVTKKAADRSTEPAEAQPGTVAVAEPREKPKRKYSRRLKRVQKLERSFSKGLHRLARATEKGVATWRKRTDRSAGKKRDGAIKDAPVNYAKAVSRAAPEAARSLVDLAKGLPKPRLGRLFR